MVAFLLATLMMAAADPAPAPSAVAVEAPKAKPEMVCHNEKPTGSHFIERVCVTREEAEKAQQAAQDTMTGLNRRAKAADKPAK
jgi:hypothetical protein